MSSAPVVVGVDGSAQALKAVGVAAREAALRGRRLRIVHALTWPVTAAVRVFSPASTAETELRRYADGIVAEAVERARLAAAGLEVSTEVVSGGPLTVLERQSRSAALLVVGSRGLNTFTGLLAGSVAVHLASHTRCPLLVVRGRPDPSGDVLLGVDGSEAGAAAVGFAFAEASLRGARLTALHVWNPWSVPVPPPPPDPSEPYASPPGALKEAEERLLSEALAGWREKYPDVEVVPRVVRGRIRQTLIEATRNAQLAVVGARGRGGFAGMLLGSVSQALLQHADCPVTVVPHDARGNHPAEA